MIKNDVKDLNRALYDEIIRCIQDESLQSFKFLNISDDIANTILIRWFKDTATKTHAVLTQLFHNYPNPFNPETTIRFDLAEPGPVTIDVFNIKGQKMKALVNDSFIAGQHSIIWNGTDSKGKPVASGVYFYRMTTPKSTLIHKMLLMK